MYNSYKSAIDSHLTAIFARERKKYKDNPYLKLSLSELERLTKGGKRLRGILIKLAQLLYNKDDDSYLNLAAAYELLQTSALIHDDIADRAALRRGEKTITAKFPGHLGLSRAVWIGDLGIFLSEKLLAESDRSSRQSKNSSHLKNLDKIQLLFNSTFYETSLGEIVDIELPYESLETHKSLPEGIIFNIYIYKTALYTISTPLEIGALSAAAPASDLKILRSFGQHLGVAFQIQDDLLGLYSSPDNLGKTTNDISENKQTIIYKHAVDHASAKDLEIIKSLYGKSDLTPTETESLLNLFDSLGSRAYAESLVKQHTSLALSELKNLSVNDSSLLADFTNSLLSRQK